MLKPLMMSPKLLYNYITYISYSVSVYYNQFIKVLSNKSQSFSISLWGIYSSTYSTLQTLRIASQLEYKQLYHLGIS